MKQYTYQAFLRGEKIGPPQTNYSIIKSQSTTRQLIINKKRSSQQKFMAQGNLLLKRLVILENKKKLLAFKKIKHQQIKKVNLKLIQKISIRFMADGFINILKASKQSSKTVEIEYKITLKILALSLSKISKEYKKAVFEQIKSFSIKTNHSEKCLENLDKIYTRLFLNVLKLSWIKLNNQVSRKFLQINVAQSMCRILPKLMRNFEVSLFKDFIKRTEVKQFHKTINEKAMTIRHTNQYQSDKMKRINHEKQMLKNAKNDLEIESSSKHKLSIELNKAANKQRIDLKDVNKAYNISECKLLQVAEQQQQYQDQILVLLNSRKQSIRKSKGMQKRVREIYHKVELSEKGIPKNLNIIPRNIQYQNIYHTYLNQKLRSLLMLYERGSSVFEKWEEDEKISKQNQAQKIMVRSIIHKSYQRDWALNFSQNI